MNCPNCGKIKMGELQSFCKNCGQSGGSDRWFSEEDETTPMTIVRDG
jgi:hypothetical protein